MIKINQRISDPGRGDCFTAVMASLLEIPYEDVPTWVADAYDESKPHAAQPRINDWLRAHGFHYLSIEWSELRAWNRLVGAECILSVPSQRLPDCSHAVIGTWVEDEPDGACRLVIIHDPQPLNAPYPPTVEPLRASFLVPFSPRLRDGHGQAKA